MSQEQVDGVRRRSLLRGMAAAGAALTPGGLVGAADLTASAAGAAPGGFSLVVGGVAAALYVDATADPAVRRVVADLQADVQRVSGLRPAVKNGSTGLSTSAVLI